MNESTTFTSKESARKESSLKNISLQKTSLMEEIRSMTEEFTAETMDGSRWLSACERLLEQEDSNSQTAATQLSTETFSDEHPASPETSACLLDFAAEQFSRMDSMEQRLQAYRVEYTKDSVDAAHHFFARMEELCDLCILWKDWLETSTQKNPAYLTQTASAQFHALCTLADNISSHAEQKFKIKTGKRYNMVLRVFENTYEKVQTPDSLREKTASLRCDLKALALQNVSQESASGDHSSSQYEEQIRQCQEKIARFEQEIGKLQRKIFGKKAAQEAIAAKQLLLEDEKRLLARLQQKR